MPAKSKQQQKFFGVVRAMQKGDIPKKGEAGEVADDMKKPDVKKMASTKHKGLPKKVKEIIAQELVKELKLNEVKPIIDPKLVSKPNDRIQYVATNDHRYPSEIVFIDTQTGHVVFFNIQRKEVERIAWNKLNSTHWVRDYIEKEFEGFLDGHSPSGKIKYQGNVNEGAMSDIDIIRQNSEDLEQFIKDFDQAYGHKIKMSSKVAKWLKGLWDMGQEVDKKPDMDRIFQKGRRTSRLTDEGNYAWKQTFPIVDPSKIGNKINIARAKAHFKQGEMIAAINKKTKKAIRISHIDQLNKLSSSTHEFAYITEGKLNEEDYKYKKYVAKAFADINDAMFNFRNAMGVKQLGQADSKVKDQLESLHQAIFDLQREFKGKGLTEYGGSEFSKITSLQNFLTIDLDKFEKGLKDSKHKAIYKKARKQFMKVVSDVAWEHSKLHEGKLTEAVAVTDNLIMKMKPGSTIKVKGVLLTKDKYGNWRSEKDPNDILVNRQIAKIAKGMKAHKAGNLHIIEGKLTEGPVDMNDPFLVQTRIMRHAAKERKALDAILKAQPKVRQYKISFDKYLELLDQQMFFQQDLADIGKQLKQMWIDMEQEAEPEGGPIADRYTRDLMKLEADYKKVKAKLAKVDARVDRHSRY